MNLRKIIATAVSAVMLLSAVSVSASFYDDEGWTMTDAYPTVAEVSARQAVVTNTVEKILLDDAVALGITKGRGASAKTDDNTDFYKVTYTINNFGPLYYACYADGEYSNYAFVKLFGITITIPGIAAKQFVGSGTFNGKAFSADAVNKVLWAAGDLAIEYPSNSEEGTLDENTTLEAVVVYAVDKGYTLDVTPTLAVAYDVKTADGNPSVDATGVAANNLVFGAAAPVEPTPVYTDSSIDVKKPVNGTTGLTDLQGQDVTLTANYGIAKFSTAIDTAANNYFVVATDSNDVEKEFEVDFAANGVEIKNASTTFFAIVKSADHIIKSIRLKEIAK